MSASRAIQGIIPETPTQPSRPRPRRNPRSLAWRIVPMLGSCWLLAACSITATRPSLDNRIVLGTTDVIELPAYDWKIEAYTCGTGVLLCDSYGPKVRCRCSNAALADSLPR